LTSKLQKTRRIKKDNLPLSTKSVLLHNSL